MMNHIGRFLINLLKAAFGCCLLIFPPLLTLGFKGETVAEWVNLLIFMGLVLLLLTPKIWEISSDDSP